MAPRDLHERVLRGLRSPFTDVRLWACRSAHDKRLRLTIREVRPLFADKSRRVQREAIRLAGLKQLTGAVPDLIDMLNSADGDLSLQAAVALDAISGKSAAPPKPRPVPGLKAKPKDEQVVQLRPVVPMEPRSISPLPGEPEFDESINETPFVGFLALVAVAAAFVCGIFVAPAFYPQVQNNDHKDLHHSFALVLEQIESPRDRAALAKTFAAILAKKQQPEEQRLQFDDGQIQKTPTPVVVKPTVSPPTPSSPLSTEEVDERVAVWLSMAHRYLESGRPKEVKRLLDKVLAVAPRSQGAKRLKRLARDRYGDIE